MAFPNTQTELSPYDNSTIKTFVSRTVVDCWVESWYDELVHWPEWKCHTELVSYLFSSLLSWKLLF